MLHHAGGDDADALAALAGAGSQHRKSRSHPGTRASGGKGAGISGSSWSARAPGTGGAGGGAGARDARDARSGVLPRTRNASASPHADRMLLYDLLAACSSTTCSSRRAGSCRSHAATAPCSDHITTPQAQR